jgi:hypothetical protein
MSDAERIAVILHGPPAAGKSMISAEICRRLGAEAKAINLDDGWGGPDDQRDRSRASGYSDIQGATERVLVIELAYGEPAAANGKGATREAERWVNLLREDGRKLYAYLLWRTWPDAGQQLFRRDGMNRDFFLARLNTYMLYVQLDDRTRFSAAVGLEEHKIVVSGRSINDVAREIMTRSGLLQAQPSADADTHGQPRAAGIDQAAQHRVPSVERFDTPESA